jgi:hypothetical protein
MSLAFALPAVRADVVARYDFGDGSFTSTDTDTKSAAGTFAAGAGLTGFVTSRIGDNAGTPFTTSAATGDRKSNPHGALFTGSSANQTTQAGAVTNNDYLSFTFTPNAGVTYNFTTLQFKLATVSNNPCPEGIFVRSSLTGTTDLTSGTITTVRKADGAFQLFSIDLTGVSALQNVATATEFRLYFYNPDGVTSTTGDRIDKVQLQAVLVPEPSTWAMIALGATLLVGVQRCRRR